MKTCKKDTPANSDRWVSMHDKKITQIVCAGDSVEFHFADGFTLIDGNTAISTKTGYVKLSGCTNDDLSCHIIRRKASRNGVKLCGKPISLKDLGKLLSQGEKAIEIFIESYSDTFVYWRGELCPYKKHGLNDWVTIETMDFFPMTYYWEDSQ